ncbi:ATP-binding cassette domain-containing protein [Janthinobacterium fluminis]|uniref:ATP-binding cassette domain-containing protein n=1 Tax=Janthinobacterium fluminis TaxID=2987524 RepID=A0ABT5K7H2_9BURK|nr:ATP-binding cassette domain-containing protein [Janthinobacterium fluminis]MDC8760955.1 ATP-binding cassette domain-containing protein [Janthinobacterium fluminis]
MEVAIDISQMSKSFGAHRVLREIELRVPERSVFAFLGNNGAGKSTTIRVMTGLLKPDSGTVRVLGRDIATQRIDILREIGCLVDSPCLYPNLSAAEFLQVACAIKRLPKSEIGRVLDIVNLRATGATRVAEFSLGMRQRLALAHAMLGQPRLLILDEPGNGLDPQGILEIRKLLAELPSRANCTVFVSSHQLDEVEKIATHLALLSKGRVICQAPVKELLAGQAGVLTLEIDNARQASALLTEMDYQVRMTGERHLEVRRIALDHADQVHARLIGAGVRLFQSVYRQPTLEQWFLDTTRTKEKDDDLYAAQN